MNLQIFYLVKTSEISIILKFKKKNLAEDLINNNTIKTILYEEEFFLIVNLDDFFIIA